MKQRALRVFGLATVIGGFLLGGAPVWADEPPCYECHDPFPAFATLHPPFADADCTACHVDHGDEERLMLVAEGAALCAECHDPMGGTGSTHPPVADGECTSCHNPHGSANRAMLVATGADLCGECHDAMKGSGSTHPPVEDGECLSCHNPHGSANAALLVAAGAALCAECHDPMEGSGSTHAPVKDGRCTACHSPHGSANRKLLVAGGEELCAKCHGESQEFKGKVQHTALDEGCGSCHQPHASENPRLLTKRLLMDRIALFDPADAALCLECHDESSFTEQESEETGFRMGNRNLHALHLNGGAVKNKYGMIKKKDGQTCYACHQPHTAQQEELLRTEYECLGTMCFTMRYVKNERGGTCVVGCHKPKTYSRDGQIAGALAERPTRNP